MDEDNKPKIDLKSRLGKRNVTAPGGMLPQPGPMGPAVNAPSGIPAPFGAPQPFSGPPSSQAPGGISQPPPGIASQPPIHGRPASGPVPGPGGGFGQPPFGAPGAPFAGPGGPLGGVPVQAVRAPQAISVEMSPEVMQAQKAGRSKVVVLALITAVVGGFLGFNAGSGYERGKGAEAAVQGARELSKDVEAAGKKIDELAEILKSAREKLGKNTFPEEEVSKLGALNVPFSGSNLSGKGVGRFKADVATALVDFASSSEAVNDRKEKLQNLLSGSKKGIQDFLEENTKPQVRWSLVVNNGPGGPWASMFQVPTPFSARAGGGGAAPPAKSEGKGKKGRAASAEGAAASGGWPDELKTGRGDKAKTLKRYVKGAPGDEQFIPVDPTTQGQVCPSDVLVRLRRELNDMEELLRGSNSPGEERVGLKEASDRLLKKLKDIGKES